MPIPADLRDEIRHAEDIGRQLYVLDKVAAIATDVLVARVPNFRDDKLAGYIPSREGTEDGRPKDSYAVLFFTTDDPPRIAYEVRVIPNAPPEFKANTPPKPATESFVLLARARAAAIAALPPIHQPMNPVIVPGAARDEKGILVYMIAGTTTSNVAVFGQHFRVLVPDDGKAPRYVMPLSKTAVELPTKGPKGQTLEALMITQIVTDWPLETHVLVSLQTKLPVYVGTRRGIWRVNGDKIVLISDHPPDEPR